MSRRFALRQLPLVLAALTAAPAFAAGVVVGTPSTFGSNGNPFGLDPNQYANSWKGNYQQVYSSSAFSGSLNINSLTFYDTVYDSHHYALDTGTFNIYLSTTSAAPNGLSSNLASNIGSNQTLVYSGTLPADTQSSLGGQFNILLSSAFNYDPSQGNLLMTVTSSNAAQTNPVYLDAQQFGSTMSSAYGSSTCSTSGACTNNTGLVTGFDVAPVPLPAALPLLLSGLAGVGAFIRRKAASI